MIVCRASHWAYFLLICPKTLYFLSRVRRDHEQNGNHAGFAVYDICRLQTADRRLQTADCRPQIADCKLNDTKNLPNKGCVFKNIKSSESERVALGTRLIFLCKVTLASFPKCFSLLFPDPLSTHPAYH